MLDWVLNTPLNILTGSNLRNTNSVVFKKIHFLKFLKKYPRQRVHWSAIFYKMRSEDVGLQLYFKKVVACFPDNFQNAKKAFREKTAFMQSVLLFS